MWGISSSNLKLSCFQIRTHFNSPKLCPPGGRGREILWLQITNLLHLFWCVVPPQTESAKFVAVSTYFQCLIAQRLSAKARSLKIVVIQNLLVSFRSGGESWGGGKVSICYYFSTTVPSTRNPTTLSLNGVSRSRRSMRLRSSGSSWRRSRALGWTRQGRCGRGTGGNLSGQSVTQPF